MCCFRSWTIYFLKYVPSHDLSFGMRVLTLFILFSGVLISLPIVEARACSDRTAIQRAVGKLDFGKAQFLLRISDPNTQNCEGYTALNFAFMHFRYSYDDSAADVKKWAAFPTFVDALLEAGANPDTVDHVFGYTPLGYLVHRYDAGLSRKDSNFKRSIGVKIIRSLLRANAKLTTGRGREPAILGVAYHGLYHLVSLFAEHGADLNAQGYFGHTPLELAAEHVDVSTIRTLLDAGADPNKRGGFGQPLARLIATHSHSDYSHPAVSNSIQALIDKGATLNSVGLDSCDGGMTGGFTPLIMISICRGVSESDTLALSNVKYLAALGVDLNPKIKTGVTSAMLAIRAPDTLSYLLDAGVDPNAVAYGFNDWTASYRAAGLGSDRALEILASHGADFNYPIKGGYTPIMAASGGNYPSAIRVLLKFKANVNAQAEDGQTALMQSVVGSKDSPELVRLLVQSGANVNLRDKQNHTALYYANLWGLKKSSEILRAVGGIE